MGEFHDARRALRRALRDTADERVLGTIAMQSGGEIRVSWYHEPHRRPVVAIAVYHHGLDEPYRDEGRTIRFHLDELPTLASSIARALDEAERYRQRTAPP